MKKMVNIFIFFLLLVTTSFLCSYGDNEKTQRVLSWTDDPYTTQTVTWKGGGKPQTIRFMEAKQYKGAFKGYREVAGERKCLWGNYYRYRADMKYLKEETEYVYCIYDFKGNAVSNVERFKTASWNKGKTEFLFIGDIQYEVRKTDYYKWKDLMEQAYRKSKRSGLILTAGDMIDSNNSRKDWETLLEAGEYVFSKMPVQGTIGNHETDGTIPSFLNMLAMPQNGPSGLEGEFYSLDYGQCHITVLNSSFLLKEREKVDGEEKYKRKRRAVEEWLKEDLSKTTAKWKIVCMHHPPYGVNDINNVYERIRQEWVPIMEKHKVRLCLSGHQHVYMRSKEINGITYIVANSGQKRSDYFDVNNQPDYVEYVNEYDSTYEIIKADKRKLQVISYNQEGEKIDEWEYGNEGKENFFERFILWIKKLW